MPASNPVIVIPGVTASYLRDLYPLPPEMIWAVIRKDYERAQLHPDDIRYEARQPSNVEADQIYEIAYRELIEELRYNLTQREDEPVPVYPFSYDWRRPLGAIEASLAEFVDEVIDRTKLLRHYFKDDYAAAPKVNLVGHSMGGLIIAGYMERFGADKIDKVATLASPFRGSFEAMVKMATGTANIGGSIPSSREREAARLTPSLYHLFPDFDTGMALEEGADLPRKTFDPAIWQPSIIETIVTYVERYAVDRSGGRSKRKEQGEKLFASLLAEAGAHRKRINGLDLAAKGFDADRWLCVVGVGAETRVRMTIELDRGRPFFRLASADRLNSWEQPEARELTGDGTVHFLGAIPGFLSRENLVCVTPSDYGYWELLDAGFSKAAGFHGILPNMDMLHRLIVRHFTGWGDPKENTWGRAAPGVAPEAWRPAVRPLRLR